MEEKLMTVEEANKVFGSTRWATGNIVGATLPGGEYELGGLVSKDYSIPTADGGVNKGIYPLIRVKGHGEISGGQIIVSVATPVTIEKDEATGEPKEPTAESYLVLNNDGKSYRINTTPVNKQFTGTPIAALVELQGKKVRITPRIAKVPTEFPKGTARTKTKMLEIAKKLGSKTVYTVVVV